MLVIDRSVQLLMQMQYPTGLFAASPTVNTGYNLAWIRDNVYTTFGLEAAQEYDAVKKAIHALFDILLKHEYKIDWAIAEKPKYHYQYIHARYNPFTMDEIYEQWGNKQNDAIGALLFKVGDLHEKGFNVLRNEGDMRILHKLVMYLESIEYWHDKDNGMWEENEELHSSSLGACIAGLKKISKIIFVPKYLIEKGEIALNKILPRESDTKEIDMAQLSLIYPYNVASNAQRDIILKNVEEKLLKEKGVIRYVGDQYYNKDGEAQWTKGLPWLAIIYKQMGNIEKYNYYIKKTLQAMNKKGELPELYYADGNEHNENSPLAWSQALFVASLKYS